MLDGNCMTQCRDGIGKCGQKKRRSKLAPRQDFAEATDDLP
jgi:hypothetical protein